MQIYADDVDRAFVLRGSWNDVLISQRRNVWVSQKAVRQRLASLFANQRQGSVYLLFMVPRFGLVGIAVMTSAPGDVPAADTDFKWDDHSDCIPGAAFSIAWRLQSVLRFNAVIVCTMTNKFDDDRSLDAGPDGIEVSLTTMRIVNGLMVQIVYQVRRDGGCRR